jgi:hypothetical protein
VAYFDTKAFYWFLNSYSKCRVLYKYYFSCVECLSIDTFNMTVSIFHILTVVQLFFYDLILCSSKNGFYHIQWKTRRTKYTFDNIGALNFVECIEECLRRKRCYSVNYSRINLFCEFNSLEDQYNLIFNDIVENNPEYIFSDIRVWDAVSTCYCKLKMLF